MRVFQCLYSQTICVGLSLQTKDCFKFSGLLVRVFHRIMHHEIGTSCSFLCLTEILGTIETKVFKFQDCLTKTLLL